MLWAGSLGQLPPPGPHFKLAAGEHESAETFKFGQPIIGATYFYWYDVYSGAHIVDPDGTDALTTHPPRQDIGDLSFRSVAWHHQQLYDVMAGGIDFILPVFWGIPGKYDDWSFVGLKNLIKAHDQADAELGPDPAWGRLPKIGMFYDTSTLKWNNRDKPIDLTTLEGREWFYITIRDFFSMVPPRKWARIDGKPIVFLYGANYAAKVDDHLFDDTRERFQTDFATDLFLVRHHDWPGRADAWYIWGGATGLKIGEHVAALGPGYDDSAVQGRTPMVVDRQRGAFYDHQWENLLRIHPRCRPWIAHVETWNEWHEGTDIARSQDSNDLYIRATSKFGGAFHNGIRLDSYGPYVNARELRWSAWREDGLHLKPPAGDGWWEHITVNGQPAVITTSAPASSSAGRYLYFDVDDSCVFGDLGLVAEVTVVFRDDGGCEGFQIEYDNSSFDIGAFGGSFRPARLISVGRADTWRTAVMQLPQVWFCNRTNGADLRLVAIGGQQRLTVREVTVRKVPGVTTNPAELVSINSTTQPSPGAGKAADILQKHK